MSLGRFTAAALNHVVEVSPALANLNFDFALFKIEPPKEYTGVGLTLSHARRDRAENGLPHKTARKLGALFSALVPATPKLQRAYGQRVSEIAQVSSLSPSDRRKYGAFAGCAGSDATSIWAAATSGSAAIAVHLLACLLARVWDPPEAVSIWVEIVKKRKSAILADFTENDIQELVAVEAAKQEISRDQLAEWDASARAWLHTADDVKKLQVKQLKLIIDNIQGTVNGIDDTYGSVIAAWTKSLSQMEGLIDGVSQKADNGEILMAVLAWHLFPDIMAVVPSSKFISQHDPLFCSGGVLTVGLQSSNDIKKGVSWSLPLACLRYYGAPVLASSSFNSDQRSKLSIEEFLHAYLGAFLSGWGVTEPKSAPIIEWLCQISDMLDTAASEGSSSARSITQGPAESSWFSLLLSAAKHSRKLSVAGNGLWKRLILLGRKHGANLLGLPNSTYFGMLRRGAFVGLIRDEDEQIDYLRQVAHDMLSQGTVSYSQMFIRYRHRDPKSDVPLFEFATAFPVARKSVKRDIREGIRCNAGHARWLWKNHEQSRKRDLTFWIHHYGQYITALAQTQEPSDPREPVDYVEATLNLSNDVDKETLDSRIEREEFEDRTAHLTRLDESVYVRDDEKIGDHLPIRLGIFWRRMGTPKQDYFRFAYGDIETAALFIIKDEPAVIERAGPPPVETQTMLSFFSEEKISKEALASHLAQHFRIASPTVDPYIQSAKAISTAAQLYKPLKNATIDVRVLQQKLFQSRWVQAATSYTSRNRRNKVKAEREKSKTPESLVPYDVDQATAFACISMFASGTHDIDPEKLGQVIAMSSDDMIYTDISLVSDISASCLSGSLRSMRGNIGRPGLVYMVPPQEPMIKEVSITEWPKLSCNVFDGRPRDCFGSTSLHLSFTGAQSTINLSFSGAQDDNIYILETLVSVHDYGKWIADLKPLKSAGLHFVEPCKDESSCLSSDAKPCEDMVAIESWLELIDTPDSALCVAQTHGNWEARFAAASLSLALNHQTIVLPPHTCWRCFRDQVWPLLFRFNVKTIVIV